MINEHQARKFCSEDISLIEGYQEAVADLSQTWDIHHRRETDEGISGRELIRRGEYLHRPASELMFLPHDEHIRLHTLGRPLSKETRKKISQATSGNKHFLGKHHSDETKKRLSLAMSGENHPFFGKHLSKSARKKLSQALSGNKHLLGYYWWNNGIKNVCAKTCPPGFVRGRIRHRISPRTPLSG